MNNTVMSNKEQTHGTHIIWNNVPTGERLKMWKQMRTEIDSLPLNEQLATVAQFFSSMPYGARSIDYYTSAEWPTPWEILSAGSFCKSSISLLMFYSLALLSNSPSIELQRIDDGTDMYLIPVIDASFVLNYELGAVNTYSDVSNDFDVKQRFTELEIKHIS